MKYPGHKGDLSIWGDEPATPAFRDDAAVFRLANDQYEFADNVGASRGIDPRTYVLASLLTPAPPESLPNALTTADPRADLNETTLGNDSIGAAQAIDRAGLSVTSNSNLYDASLPSLVIQGNVSSPSDQDYFSITLQAGELLVLDVDGTDGLDSHLHLYGPNGSTAIGDNDDYVIVDPGSELAATHTQDHHNTDSLIHFRAVTAGTYYFSIGAFQDAQFPTSGTYQLNVSIGPQATPAQIAAEDIQALQSGAFWTHTNLTYGFPTSTSQYPTQFAETTPATKFAPFNPTQTAAAIQFFQSIAAVSGLTFQQGGSPGQADLRFAMSDEAEPTAYGYYPTNGGPNSLGGSAWFNKTDFTNPIKGNYAWMGILHETGHTLGLKHGQEFPIALSADHDSLEFSVMTYRSYPGGSPTAGYSNETFGYPQTLMIYDIAALQALYGANFTTNSGNSVYSWNPTTGEMSINGVGQGAPGNGAGGSANRIFETIWDGGGTDTFDMSNYGGGVSIDLNPGGWSTTTSVQLANLGAGHYARGNVFNALEYNGDPRSLIENAIGGAGNDVIVGNDAANRLEGRGGNDQLFGNAGNDSFYFTNDLSTFDRVDGGPGTNDQIGIQGDYTGANRLVMSATTITNIEALVVLPGFSYDITTNDGNVAAGARLIVQATQLDPGQSLAFNGAAETDGSFLIFGSTGNDTLTGGSMNDGFYFGPGQFNGADIVNGGPGANDQLGLDGNYALTLGGNITNIEAVVLLPGPSSSLNHFNLTTAEAFVAPGQSMLIYGVEVSTAIGFDGSAEHDGSFTIYGGSAADVLTGGANADWIFGGAGGDTLTGGNGADTFYYDDVAQSTSTSFDRLVGFNENVDRIDLPGTVTGFAGSASGALNMSGMDATLASAFSGLGSHQAALFTATGGDLAGDIFVVVDANGVAGYQAGADYVIGFISPATPIDPTTSIFI